MSLEDTPRLKEDVFEVGDKVITIPPDVMSDITPDLHLANHNKQSVTYYVQRLPPLVRGIGPNDPPVVEQREQLIIHLIPKSREGELKPE